MVHAYSGLVHHFQNPAQLMLFYLWCECLLWYVTKFKGVPPNCQQHSFIDIWEKRKQRYTSTHIGWRWRDKWGGGLGLISVLAKWRSGSNRYCGSWAKVSWKLLKLVLHRGLLSILVLSDLTELGKNMKYIIGVNNCWKRSYEWLLGLTWICGGIHVGWVAEKGAAGSRSEK